MIFRRMIESSLSLVHLVLTARTYVRAVTKMEAHIFWEGHMG